MATFILVHGGFWGGWCWKKVKKFLESKTHIVYTPTLTGLGERSHLNHAMINVDTHIQDITNLIIFEDLHDIILVGHSYAGLVITGVASALPERIKQLIYLDALVPDNGDSLLTLADNETAQFFVSQAQEKGYGWLIPPFPIDETDFADKNEINWYTSRLTPQALNSFSQKISFNKEVVSKIHTSFIHCRVSSFLRYIH